MRIRVHAPAKVNLHLAVGEQGPEGYHAVTTVMHAIELGDEIVIAPADTLGLTCTPEVGVDPQRNLAWRAAVAMGEAYSRDATVAIELLKRVPHGAGLGGGSSDAAGAIAGLAALWGVDRADERCVRVARSLGADVAFFLGGSGCALMGGRGDVLEREMPGMTAPIVVVRPPQPVPTVAAYAAFDRAPVAPSAPDAMLSAVAAHDAAQVGRSLANNLAAAAVSVVPAVADALAYVQAQPGVRGAAVSGSGSAVFGVCESADAAEQAAEGAAERGWWGVATALRPTGVSVSVEESE